jgi:hypothetical protein
MPVPSLTQALANVIERSLSSSADKLIRVEDVHGTDIDELMQHVDERKEFRLGFITPYTNLPTKRRTGVSRDPRTITKWRNETVVSRRSSPVVIIGNASGKNESGLKKVPVVVRPSAVLSTYRELLLTYLESEVQSRNPQALTKILVAMASESLIDAAELNSFFAEVLKTGSAAVSAPQQKLWKLRLIPDPRAMDESSPGARLSKNYQTVELLRNQADTVVEEKQLERLEAAANEGNEIAIRALKFRGSGKKEDLKEIELDALLALMNARGTVPPTRTRTSINFFDALDKSLISPDHLRQLADRWRLDTEAFSTELEIEQMSLRVGAKADKRAFGLIAEGGQVIATERIGIVGASSEDANSVYGDQLLQAARNADVVKGRSVYEPLATNLLSCRAELAHFPRWHSDLFLLLIVSDSAKTLAADYLRAWEALTDAVLQDEERAAVSALVSYLSMLDGQWVREPGNGGSATFERVELVCIHPFVLRPLLELAEHARKGLGEENLGNRLLWAYDRVLPAYPALWRANEIFVHTDGTETPTYAVKAQRSLPGVSTATGIVDVVRSFVGLHPYAQRHLSVLLIDPPAGGGIGRALDDCLKKHLTKSLKIFIAHTDRRDTEFPTTGANIEYVGGIGNAAEWAKACNVLVHIAIAFRRARDSETGSHTGAAEPSRGLHNSLTATLEPPEGTGDQQGSWIPKVVIQPRDSNDVVRKFMLLARQSYGPERLYRISPMLPEKESVELESLAKVADWTVVASPSPIGLVPPRSFPQGELTYLGREDCGPYGLFVYSRDLFSVRKRFEALLTSSPIAASAEHIEKEIQKLALTVPNGILRIGRGDTQVIAQVGMMVASHFAQESRG